MDAEEAAMQMDLLGHNYLFLGMQKRRVNVVYKRKAGTFGLINLSLIIKPSLVEGFCF